MVNVDFSRVQLREKLRFARFCALLCGRGSRVEELDVVFDRNMNHVTSRPL